MKRIKRVLISGDQFFKLLTTKNMVDISIEGIPHGSEFRGFGHDWTSNCICIFVEHPSFDLIENGAYAPELLIKIDRTSKLDVLNDVGS